MIIQGMSYDGSCVICGQRFTEEELNRGEVEGVPSEPIISFGRFVNKELKLFHKGTAYHIRCFYRKGAIREYESARSG